MNDSVWFVVFGTICLSEIKTDDGFYDSQMIVNFHPRINEDNYSND